MKKMNKKLILIMAVIVMLIGCTSVAYAETVNSGNCGDNITWTLDEDGVLILSGTGTTEGDPYSYEPPWQSSADDIKKVVIEEGIEKLKNGTFDYCTNLKEVHLPSTLVHLDYGAFDGCNSVEKVYIADLVSYLNMKINNDAYLGNGKAELYVEGNSAKELIIPDGVTEIKKLNGFSNIEKVVIPKSVKKIQLGTFDRCFNLKEVVIKGNPKVRSAFHGCPLKTVTAPKLDGSKMEIFDNFALTTSNHTTNSVKISWPKLPNIKKIEILKNGELIATLKDTEKTSYTIKGKRVFQKGNLALIDGHSVIFYYDDGKNSELDCFMTSLCQAAYKPYKTTISKLNTGSKYIKVQWKKNKSSEVDGYQVQIAANSKFTSGKKTYTVKDEHQLSKKISKLEKGKKYYVRVRAYEVEKTHYSENAPVKTIYGSWSDVKSITCK